MAAINQSETAVHRTADCSRTGDAVEYIVGRFFPQMMDQKNGDLMLISNLLQHGKVTVVVGIGAVIVAATDHLQGVDDDENCVRICGNEAIQLLL